MRPSIRWRVNKNCGGKKLMVSSSVLQHSGRGCEFTRCDCDAWHRLPCNTSYLVATFSARWYRFREPWTCFLRYAVYLALPAPLGVVLALLEVCCCRCLPLAALLRRDLATEAVGESTNRLGRRLRLADSDNDVDAVKPSTECAGEDGDPVIRRDAV